MAFAACCWVGRLPFGGSPSSLNRGMGWSTVFFVSQALYSVILIPEPRPIPGSGVLLAVDFAGSQSSAGGCPGARQRAAGGGRRAAGNRTNGQFQVLVSPLSPPRRVVSQPLSNQDPDRPSLSLSLPLADQGPVNTAAVEDSVGMYGIKLPRDKVGSYLTTQTSMVHSTTGDSVGLQVAGGLLCLRMVRVRGSSETITPGRGTRC